MRRSEEELSYPMAIAELNKRTPLPSGQELSDRSWTLCSLQTSQLPFLTVKVLLFPCCGKNCMWLSMVSRLQITILCGSQINPSLLKKYLAVFLFQINRNMRVWQQNLFGCGIAFSSMRKDKSHPGEGIPGVLWGRSNSDVRQTRKLRN